VLLHNVLLAFRQEQDISCARGVFISEGKPKKHQKYSALAIRVRLSLTAHRQKMGGRVRPLNKPKYTRSG
jgi:hypothetical protein